MLLCAGCTLGAWLCACEDQADIPAPAGKTTTVTLRIGTNSSEGMATRADANVKPYEGLRTLRVIVTDVSKTNIWYNNKFDVDRSKDPQEAVLTTKVQLEKVPVGPANIYLIANEESLGVEYTNETLQSNSQNNKLEVKDETWTYFPATYEKIKENGLPMSQSENVEIKENTPISISLDRAVVKIHLTVVNATAGDLTLNWVEFGPFISDRFYMFREQELDIPADTKYKKLRYPETGNFDNIVLKKGEATNWNSIYIYPNRAYSDPLTDNPYTLALGTNAKDYPASLLGLNENVLIRNHQLNITARITASATISVDYKYVSWVKTSVDVPPFN